MRAAATLKIDEAVPALAAVEPLSIAEALRRPREEIEAAFLEVGGRLAECSGELGALAETFEQLPRDFESAELVQATEKLDAVALEAARMAASFAEERPTMTGLTRAVEKAQTPIASLQAAIKTIGIVAVNARIAAASLVGDAEGVGVFTTDIVSLAEEAENTVQALVRLHAKVTKDVRRANEQRESFERSHEKTLGELSERISARLRQVAQRRSAAAEASLETGRTSRRIADEVSAAVFALQVGDNTRQRIEHIEAALELAEAALGDGAHPDLEAAEDLDAEEREGFGAALVALEAAQLEDAVGVFEREVGEAGRSVRSLATDVADVIRQSRSLYAGDDKSASVAELSAELRVVAALLSDCEAERAMLDVLAGEVVAAVGALLRHMDAVRLIEQRMRLLSLNATVKCSNLGPRGRALSVIAEQIRELTVETGAAAEASVKGLERAAGFAETVTAASAERANDDVGRLETEALEAVELLETVDGRLVGAVAALERAGPSVVKQLETASTALSRQTGIAAELKRQAVRLEGGDATACSGEAARDVLAQVRKRYTMESERRVHDAMFGAPPASAVEETALEPSAEDDLDDVFF